MAGRPSAPPWGTEPHHHSIHCLIFFCLSPLFLLVDGSCITVLKVGCSAVLCYFFQYRCMPVVAFSKFFRAFQYDTISLLIFYLEVITTYVSSMSEDLVAWITSLTNC